MEIFGKQPLSNNKIQPKSNVARVSKFVVTENNVVSTLKGNVVLTSNFEVGVTLRFVARRRDAVSTFTRITVPTRILDIYDILYLV